MKHKILTFIMLVVVITTINSAAELKFKGFVQTWFSYAQQEQGEKDSVYGVTFRRIRFTPYGTLSKNISWTLQFGWDKFTAQIIDAYIDFKISKELNFRIGHYTVPGAMSSTLTSSSKMDLIERPQITQNWNSNSGLSSYRTIGIQASGKLLNDKLYYAVMLANAKASSIFTPSVKSSDYTNTQYGLTLWTRLETYPVEGLSLGAFFGTGKETDTEMERSSYGGHLYFVKKGINFKVEYIGGKLGRDNGEIKYNGMFVHLGYKIKKIEPIARYDFYTPVTGDFDSAGVKKYNNVTLGINYFHNDNVKFQANYVIRDESMAAGLEKIKNNLFYVCLQYSY